MRKLLLLISVLVLVLPLFLPQSALATDGTYLIYQSSDGELWNSGADYSTVRDAVDAEEVNYDSTGFRVGQRSNWATLYTGAETESYQSSVFAGDGSLNRFRTTSPGDFSGVEYQRITTPISESSDWSTWDSNIFPIPTRVIDSYTTGVGESSVAFSNIDTIIPSGSRHLVVVVNAASADAVAHRDLELQFNSDSGANYNDQFVKGNNAVASATRATGQTSLTLFSIPGTSYANSFGGGSITVPHAFNTANHKAILAQGGAVEDEVVAVVGRWASTAAITDVLLEPDTGNFAEDSVFQLCVVDERYLVEEVELSSDGTITFDNIPQEDGNLVVIGYERSDRADAYDVVLHSINGDTNNANYARQLLNGDSAVPGASSNSDRWLNKNGAAATSTANVFSPLIVTYSQFTEDNQPHFLAFSGLHSVAGGYSTVSVVSGRRANTEPITKLEFDPNIGTNFKAGTFFSLYITPTHPIERVELTEDTASVTFDNIPQNYDALQLNIYARSSAGGNADGTQLSLNDDAVNANYDYQYLRGRAGAVSALRSAASRQFVVVPASGEGANEYGGASIVFPAYTRTDAHKFMIAIYGICENRIQITSARWENLAAITKITYTLDGGDFVAGTVFELVGIGEGGEREARAISACSSGATVDLFSVCEGGDIWHLGSDDNGQTFDIYEDTHLDATIDSSIAATRKDGSTWRIAIEPQAWWATNYTYRKQIVFDNSSINREVTNIPVYVELDNTNFDFTHAWSDGRDIRFVDEDGSTALDYWFEEYDSTGEYALIWVDVPQIDNVDTDYVWLYYGYAAAVDGQDQPGTYETACVMAQTFDEGWGVGANDVDLINSTTVVYDETSNNNDGTLYMDPTALSINGAGGEGADWFIADWAGTALSVETTLEVEGVDALKNTIAVPVATTDYNTDHDPAGSWDWSSDKHLVLWLRSDRASTAYTNARIYIYDTIANWRYWDITFDADTWKKQKVLLSTGDGESGTPPLLTLIDYVRINFTAADTTPFVKYLDYLSIDDRPVFEDGEIGRALDFDGVDDYVDCGNDASLDITDEITIESWVRVDGGSGANRTIVDKYLYSASKAFVLTAYTDNKFRFTTVRDAEISTVANNTFTVGVWYYVVCTSEVGEQKLYVNGVAQTDVDVVAGQILVTANPVIIGNSGNRSYYFDGFIDSVGIYNRVLSADEIKARYIQTAANYIDFSPELAQTDTLVICGDMILGEQDFDSVSGVSMEYYQDYNLVVTGVAGSVDGVFTVVWGDGGNQAAGTWSTVYSVITSATASYDCPSLIYVSPGNEFRLNYIEAPGGSDVMWITHSTGNVFTNLSWREPYIFAYGSGFYNYGLSWSYAGSGDDIYMSAPHRVYRSSRSAPYGGTYYSYRGYLVFDTSGLPRNISITAATVSLYGKVDESDTNFNIVLVDGSGTDGTVADYGVLGGRTTSLNDVFSTAGFSIAAYNELDLSAWGLLSVVKGGITRFGVRSSLDISDTAPTGDEYIEAWSSEGGVGYQPMLAVTYTVSALGTPPEFEIYDVAVFNGYLQAGVPTPGFQGDQLYLFRYNVTYETEPSYNPKSYYWMQLLDGSDIEAQVPLPAWGYKPGSIYLNSDSALPSGGAYTIKIVGNSDKFVSPPETSVDLESAGWLGSDYEQLDSWVRRSATLIQTYDRVDDPLVEYIVDIGTGDRKITDSGRAIFVVGVPNLEEVRPDLFVSTETTYAPPERAEHLGTFESGLSDNFGSLLVNSFEDLGSVFGVQGEFVGAVVWVVLMGLVAGLVVVVTGQPTGGIIVVIPFLLLGNYMGVIPLVITASIGVISTAWLFHRIWLRT